MKKIRSTKAHWRRNRWSKQPFIYRNLIALRDNRYHSLHFTNDETKAQRGEVCCSRPCHCHRREPGFTSGSSGSHLVSFLTYHVAYKDSSSFLMEECSVHIPHGTPCFLTLFVSSGLYSLSLESMFLCLAKNSPACTQTNLDLKIKSLHAVANVQFKMWSL